VYRLALVPPGTYVVGVHASGLSMPAAAAAEIDGRPASPTSLSPLESALLNSAFSIGSRSGAGQRVGDFVWQQSGGPLAISPTGRPLGYANTWYPGTTNSGDSTLIEIHSGETRTGIDVPMRFAETFNVSGTLSGPSGPMPNVVVRLVPPGGDIGDLDLVGISQAITDQVGRFMFGAVVPGEYMVRAVRTLAGSNTPADAVCLWANAPLTVGEADVHGLVLTMRPGIKLSGRVEFKGGVNPSRSGAPIVVLQPLGAASWRTSRAMLQEDGSFTTGGDPAGRYVISAFQPPGWTWVTTTLRGRSIADEPVELSSTDVTDLVLTYVQTSTHVSGIVLTSSGSADPDTDVIAFPADTTAWRIGGETTRRVRRVHAISSGAFDIEALPPGEYYLAAVSARFVVQWPNPQFLERLIGGATRITLAIGDQKTMPLHVITPAERP
jgi:hypothetical protein